MKILLWVLFFLGVLAIIIGTILAFTGTTWKLAPEGYWRGAMAFWVLTLTLHFLTGGCCHPVEGEKKE